MILLIGEQFGDYSDSVCGAVVQIRTKGDKLAIWTSNASDQDTILSIGYETVLALSFDETDFQLIHDDFFQFAQQRYTHTCAFIVLVPNLGLFSMQA